MENPAYEPKTSQSPPYILQLVLKRVIDRVGAAAGLVVLSPLFLILALAIKLDSPGPIFFVQERVGKGLRPINVLKFRSMVLNANQVLNELFERDPSKREEFERTQKLEIDVRITRVGRFLRRTSLDELPQLLNVLVGSMSLVGPRPPIASELPLHPMWPLVLTMVPGMTGLWQVSGRSQLSYEQRMDLNIRYATQWNLSLDIRILVLTVPAVLSRRGAY